MPVDPSRAKLMPLLICFLLGVEEPIGGCPEVRNCTTGACLLRHDDYRAPLSAGGVRSYFDLAAFVLALHRLHPYVRRSSVFNQRMAEGIFSARGFPGPTQPTSAGRVSAHAVGC